MAQTVPLQVQPNQSLTIRLDGASYEIAIKTAGSVMIADIARDGAALVNGQRCLAGAPLLPYRYLQTGNFVFLTNNDTAPWWESFDTQALVYLTAVEVTAP